MDDGSSAGTDPAIGIRTTPVTISVRRTWDDGSSAGMEVAIGTPMTQVPINARHRRLIRESRATRQEPCLRSSAAQSSVLAADGVSLQSLSGDGMQPVAPR